MYVVRKIGFIEQKIVFTYLRERSFAREVGFNYVFNTSQSQQNAKMKERFLDSVPN
jgi:hypothetical protein